MAIAIWAHHSRFKKTKRQTAVDYFTYEDLLRLLVPSGLMGIAPFGPTPSDPYR